MSERTTAKPRPEVTSNLNAPAANSTQLSEIMLGTVADRFPNAPFKNEPRDCGCGEEEGTCNGDEQVPQYLILTPTADAYVDSSQGDVNFGEEDVTRGNGDEHLWLLADNDPQTYETSIPL